MMRKRLEEREEMQRLEAIGIIKASRLVRRLASSKKNIDVSIIRKIHVQIFEKSWPDIAGEYRKENLRIRGAAHKPPHYTQVPKMMDCMGAELEKRLAKLSSVASLLMDVQELSKEQQKNFDQIIEVTAWVHHQVVYIHPFRDGNGRTSRLIANLILERFGLVGISLEIERDNKNRYCDALGQIDSKYTDYEPLKSIIYEGLIDRYNSVST